MDPARIDRLVADLRAARERGRPYRFAEIAGRLALRIERANGAQISFVSPAERAAIESALAAPPRGFSLGEVRIQYDERRQCYEGRDGAVSLSFVDLPEDPPSTATIALLGQHYAALRRDELRLCAEAATRLDRLARTWSTTPAAIRAALKLTSVTFYGTRPVPLLSTGEPFGDHFAELELDANGRVVDVTLAG